MNSVLATQAFFSDGEDRGERFSELLEIRKPAEVLREHAFNFRGCLFKSFLSFVSQQFN